MARQIFSGYLCDEGLQQQWSTVSSRWLGSPGESRRVDSWSTAQIALETVTIRTSAAHEPRSPNSLAVGVG